MENKSSLFCRQCGTKLKSEDQKFCANCGSRIEFSEEIPKTVFCTQCGTENKSEAAFCMSCGAPFDKSKAAEMQNAAQFGQAVQSTAQPDVNWSAQEQKRHLQKKPIPKIAIILPVCIVAIAVIAFGILAFRNSSRTTPFTEYLSLVGSDYKELYSDAYDITQPYEYLDYYYATTDISFMDIGGTGSFFFYHTEDEETLSSLAESGIETDTVLSFSWSCDASVYSLDDVCAAFESIYGDSPMHGTYSYLFDSKDTWAYVESYCWENAEGGYDLELYLFSESDRISATWYAHPDVEGSYEDLVAILEKALEDRDVSAYENLLYGGDNLSVSDSLTDTITDFLSSEEIDQIDYSIGETIKVTTFTHVYLLNNYYLSMMELERVESLYIVNMDLTLYQGESIIFGASCKIDIAYINDEWRIIGIFLEERFSDELLVELAKQYYEYVHGTVPPIVEIDHYEGDDVVIHLYETNGGSTATWDWYTIDPYTCEGTDFLGNEIRLYDFFADVE